MMPLTAILVVDDSELLHRMYDLVLMRYRQRGVRVVHARNGAEALSTVRRDAIDLILLDINMPVLDGIQTLTQLGQSGELARLSVIMVSTEGRERDVTTALALGAVGYVTKPFSPANLHEIIDRTFESLPLRAKQSMAE